MNSTKLKISADDGCASDIRLADLARRYEIETIFYWPVEWHSLAYQKGYRPLSFSEAQEIADNFEIGAHTITHRLLTDIPLDQAIDEIRYSGRMLESLFNIEVNKFCPPRGYTNPELTSAALDYYDSQRLTKGKHLVHIHPDSGANDNIPWYQAVNDSTEELWCHTWEMDKYNLWEELELFLENTYS